MTTPTSSRWPPLPVGFVFLGPLLWMLPMPLLLGLTYHCGWPDGDGLVGAVLYWVRLLSALVEPITPMVDLRLELLQTTGTACAAELVQVVYPLDLFLFVSGLTAGWILIVRRGVGPQENLDPGAFDVAPALLKGRPQPTNVGMLRFVFGIAVFFSYKWLTTLREDLPGSKGRYRLDLTSFETTNLADQPWSVVFDAFGAIIALWFFFLGLALYTWVRPFGVRWPQILGIGLRRESPSR
jgi:hypothetical protein